MPLLRIGDASKTAAALRACTLREVTSRCGGGGPALTAELRRRRVVGVTALGVSSSALWRRNFDVCVLDDKPERDRVNVPVETDFRKWGKEHGVTIAADGSIIYGQGRDAAAAASKARKAAEAAQLAAENAAMRARIASTGAAGSHALT